MEKRIFVVGVDDSPLAPAVLDRALDEAKQFGAELHVVHVAHLPTGYYLAWGAQPVDGEEIMERAKEAIWQNLTPKLSREGVTAQRIDLEGYPPDTLVEYTHGVGAERLIVGTRSHGELHALILGSTSHRALHLAKCDVLVVKPH